ncbi:hypothetical protein JRO89_XS10G0105900 [Xanthoceras sorbifolium]|uniref:BHLH domain-containing protein n=1 Tax=Xanthoceras sorbifolium TaxID=99658 RepID=A0ABQ8HIG3_9ROSI|nr:hypothetical protein JRO89_XS10G0105900 [Xanthoceras sorbifolium]
MARISWSSRAKRNITEKNRRIHMKNLIGRLTSLLPHQPSNSKQLKRNNESLKRKKAILKGDNNKKKFDHNLISNGPSKQLPIINITTFDSILEVNLLVSGFNKNFMFYEIINVLEEEGAQVIDAVQTKAGDQIIYTIKSKPTLDAKMIDDMIKFGKVFNDKQGIGFTGESKATTSGFIGESKTFTSKMIFVKAESSKQDDQMHKPSEKPQGAQDKSPNFISVCHYCNVA